MADEEREDLEKDNIIEGDDPVDIPHVNQGAIMDFPDIFEEEERDDPPDSSDEGEDEDEDTSE